MVSRNECYEKWAEAKKAKEMMKCWTGKGRNIKEKKNGSL